MPSVVGAEFVFKAPKWYYDFICKACTRENSKVHYRKHKAKHNVGRYARRILERKKIKELLTRLKDRPCMDCGESHPYWAMDFDHRIPSNKNFTISGSNRIQSLKKVEAEAAKCDVVCALCHRYRTHGSLGGGTRTQRPLAPKASALPA